ncbi:MAG: hypothetical protein C4346_13560 [Chloroflexota bacterium]
MRFASANEDLTPAFGQSSNGRTMMGDPRLSELRALAQAGLISRREALTRGLQLGLSLPAIAALMRAAPASAAPQPRRRAILPRPQNGNG